MEAVHTDDYIALLPGYLRHIMMSLLLQWELNATKGTPYRSHLRFSETHMSNIITLRQLITEVSYTEKSRGGGLFRRLLKDILLALNVLHSRNLVHGNVSMDTIFYDTQSTKFYLQSFHHMRTRRRVSACRYPFISNDPLLVDPTCLDAESKSRFSARCQDCSIDVACQDVWALGVVLLQVLNIHCVTFAPQVPMISRMRVLTDLYRDDAAGFQSKVAEAIRHHAFCGSPLCEILEKMVVLDPSQRGNVEDLCEIMNIRPESLSRPKHLPGSLWNEIWRNAHRGRTESSQIADPVTFTWISRHISEFYSENWHLFDTPPLLVEDRLNKLLYLVSRCCSHTPDRLEDLCSVRMIVEVLNKNNQEIEMLHARTLVCALLAIKLDLEYFHAKVSERLLFHLLSIVTSSFSSYDGYPWREALSYIEKECVQHLFSESENVAIFMDIFVR